MARRPAGAARANPEASLDAGFWLVVLLAGACLVLVGVTVLGGGTRPAPAGVGPGDGATAGATAAASTASIAPGDMAGFLYPTASAAPPLALLDPDERPVDLAAMRGGLVLVFFGYTHCPDVCPATIGTVGSAMRDFGPGVRAVFVSVDPERDTPAWLREYVAYMPAGFTVVTGPATQVRATADAWGVRYARVETGTPGAYTISHTADVFLVDGTGTLRAHFPFGTSPAAVTATLRLVGASAGPSIGVGATPSAPATPGGSVASASPSAPPPTDPSVLAGLRVELTSSSVWAGGPAPVILALYGPAGRLDDASVNPTVQLQSTDGVAVGPATTAVAVRPPGVDAVSYVATLSIPTPGWWRVAVTVRPGALTLGGTTDVAVLDPGATAPIGAAAPTIHSPTLDDVGGDARRVTTDPLPDLRLYRHSTSDVLAAGTPFVFVLDSTKFRVTPACGKAIVLARYLQDRWPSVPFIHHEPYRYSVVTDTPVLDGSLGDPPLTDVATAWGIGAAPWGAASMPWVFVVDGHGIVRAKYQGILGSDDVDVIVALIAQGG